MRHLLGHRIACAGVERERREARFDYRTLRTTACYDQLGVPEQAIARAPALDLRIDIEAADLSYPVGMAFVAAEANHLPGQLGDQEDLTPAIASR